MITPELNELKNLSSDLIDTKLVELLGDISNPKRIDKVELIEIFKNDVRQKTYLTSLFIAISIFSELRNKKDNSLCDVIDYYLILYVYYVYKQCDIGFKYTADEKIDLYLKKIFTKISRYKEENIEVIQDTLVNISDDIKQKNILANFGECNLYFLEKVADYKKINLKDEMYNLPQVGDFLNRF